MTNSNGTNQENGNCGNCLEALGWAQYAEMVSASVEQALRVVKFGGLSQPDVAKSLKSSRAFVSEMSGTSASSGIASGV